jgi:excisionase family DNA binding protein
MILDRLGKALPEFSGLGAAVLPLSTVREHQIWASLTGRDLPRSLMVKTVVRGLQPGRRAPILAHAPGGPTLSELDDILTTEEAAKLLKVSERTLERWRVRRRIPYVEYPRQGTWAPIRFRRTDILEWLRQHVVKPTRSGDQPA